MSCSAVSDPNRSRAACAASANAASSFSAAASFRLAAARASYAPLVFFAVVLVGFAFVWRRGDLDLVRAVRHPATPGETAVWMAKIRRNGY